VYLHYPSVELILAVLLPTLGALATNRRRQIV